MKATLAISNVKTPHNGRFISVRKVCSTVWTNSEGKTVHFEIQRDGGPYMVLKMDIEAAEELAKDMAAAAQRAREGA